MKLKTARVTNYKCVFDSEEFSVSDVTALVGKNESGKSAILYALYKLNPAEDSDKLFSDIEEYPRSKYSEYEEIKSKSPANVVTTKWQLDSDEIAELDKIFGKGSLTDEIVTISKGYNNITNYSVQIDEVKVLNHLKNTVVVESSLKTALSAVSEVTEYLKLFEELSKTNPEADKEYKNLIQYFPEKKAIKGFVNIISSFLPSFVYFADYHKLPGQVSVENLNAKTAAKAYDFGDKVFLSLLGLVGTTIEELSSLSTFEKYIAKLESVSMRLTKEIFLYWTQNRHLEVDFRFDAGRSGDKPPFNTGFVFRTRIRNTRHGVTVSFDERSTGFVWFFSFLVYFSQIKKTFGDKLVILLDEPGLSLHAKAQADFLRYVNEKLAPNYQVLYTTHSPFLIDQDKILNVRTVEDKIKGDELLGTKVGEEVLSIDKDTILPLQAALGYEITQSLFISPNTILVEGPSDLLYLKFFSNELIKKGREGLNPKWAIAPAGGIDKISSFVILFNSQKLNIAVVTDFHKGDKKKIESLKESKILKSGNVFTINSYLEAEEADIEDLIGHQLYLDIVNHAYSLKEENKLKIEKDIKRIVEFVENKFRVMPSEISEYDHYRPSEFLTTCDVSIKNLLSFDESLNNFESLFKDLNKALSI